MAEDQSTEKTSVSSRITLFNKHVERHQHFQRINPFSHCHVQDVPKRNFLKEQYGTAPSGSLSEYRALLAKLSSLQEILRLCELINEKGEKNNLDNNSTEVSIKFGVLFEMYNHISDKLLGTLLCARKNKYVDFHGETLFQGRDDAAKVRLLRPFEELRNEIQPKIEKLRSTSTEKLRENPELRAAQFS